MSIHSLVSYWQKLRQNLSGGGRALNLGRRRLHDLAFWKDRYSGRPAADLQAAVVKLRRRAGAGESPDDLLPESFALTYEAVRQALGLTPFDEQLIGGMVLQAGMLAEMQTGEGKTLTAVFPACLQALTGRGVHILTFNDYLARRDADWMGPAYRLLGFSIGLIREGLSAAERRAAYAADITYLTAKEAGFDYLRDSLCLDLRDTVQRDFNFALVDEADSILIDEARIPLILAGSSPAEASGDRALAEFVRGLLKIRDYDFDDYSRNVHLTEHGLKLAEARLGGGNLYDERNLELLTRLNCALHAAFLLRRDKDYLVRGGRVELVDEFTGRVAERRRWPDGLQAALEAKEGLAAGSQGRILNTITLQHFIRRYPRLAGMTATARPAAAEFAEFYGLDVATIPPHVPCRRIDHPDILFATREAKERAVSARIAAEHARLRPVLVGTASVAESEALAAVLRKQGIPCRVLNARQDAHEAELIARAGRLGAVTIATNMAGRGTDIRLGEGDASEKSRITALGGLLVLGTHKHESARIDDQLRGRAGRQGDPGESRFYVSLEDELYVKHRLASLLPARYAVDASDETIRDPRLLSRVSQLQRIVEGQNLEIKKTLRRYSGLPEQQRRLLDEWRRRWLHPETRPDLFRAGNPRKLKAWEAQIGAAATADVCRRLMLLCLDDAWSQYLAELADVREGIHIVRLGGQDPLSEFHRQAIELFDRLEGEHQERALDIFDRLELKNGRADFNACGLQLPSATWTYLVNDDPFETQLAGTLAASIPLSLAAGIWWPLLAVVSLLRKYKKRK